MRVWRVWGEVRKHDVGGGLTRMWVDPCGLTRGWVDPCTWPDPWVGGPMHVA